MIPAAVLLFAGAFLSISSTVPDTPLQVGYDRTITIPAEGATAAYAVDPSIAEATVVENGVRVHGKGPGTTAVVIVTPSSVLTARVTVSEPPLILPSNFNRGIGGTATNAGSAELRYVSQPGEISTTLDLRRQETERSQRLRVVTANPIGSNGEAGTAFPFVSYQVSTPARDVTLLDQAVLNSPLTLNGELVRGLHVREGPWSFHGGVTSIALFQNAFFSTAPEYVAGVTRDFHPRPDHTVGVNAYFFRNAAEDREIATNGGVASLLHTYRSPVRNLLVRSELGISREGIATAAQVVREEPGLHVAASVRYEPPKFPSLAIANLHGLFADADVVRTRSERTTISGSAVLSDFRLPAVRQQNAGASATLSHKITPHFTTTAGALYSGFHSDAQRFDLKTLSTPVGIDYTWTHAYAGVRDQPTTDLSGRIANGYGVNAGTSLGHFSVSGFFRHDVDLPAVSTFLSAVPGLQEALERSGIFVARPAQLIALLRDVGLLAQLGFTTPLDLRLAPSRNDIGANADWFGDRQRLSLSVFKSNTQLVNDSYELKTASLSYTRTLESGAEVAGFVTWGGTVGGSDHPLVGFLMRHPVASLSRLLPGARGDIAGHVFRDDEATATYSAAAANGLAGVEVLLDDTRSTRTDAKGAYAFRRIPSGRHRLEVKMPTNQRFFLTTDSPAFADVNSVVDFGVSFVRGAVFGSVVNDAGEGIAGVRVDLEAATLHRNTVTDAVGEFRFNAVPDGEYVVSTSAETYPIGYDLSSLAQEHVRVKEAEPAEAKIVAKALRSISGSVMRYDEKVQKEVPVAGAEVAIPELSLATKTSEAGKYLFRRVPAGTFTIVIGVNGERRRQVVMVPAQPATVVAEKISIARSMPGEIAQKEPEPPPAPVAIATPVPVPAPASVPVAPATDAVALSVSGDFRGAVAAFERSGVILRSADRYYYAIALYEVGRYADAKRELAASQPPDTDEARRYAAKIAGAIVWR